MYYLRGGGWWMAEIILEILDQYLPNIEIKMETSIKGSLAIFWVALILENKTYSWIGLFKWHHDLRIKKFKLNEKLHKRDTCKRARSYGQKVFFWFSFWLFWQVTSIYTRREGCLTDQKTILVKILSGLRIEFEKV